MSRFGTEFKKHETILREAVGDLYKQKFRDSIRTSFAHKALALVNLFGLDSEDIHSRLPNSEENTLESQSFNLIVYFLRLTLPLERLRELCLMPPEGCPLERWMCCGGPCRSSDLWKTQKLDTVKHLRRIAGHQDDLGEDYYEKFDQFWGQYKRRSGIIGVNTPLMLFPVKKLGAIVKDTIVSRKPDLRDVADNLFVCVDHFKNTLQGERVVDKRRLNSFSIEHINRCLDNKSIRFKLSKGLSKRSHKAFVEKLTDGYMADIPMQTDIIGRVLSLAGIKDNIEQSLSKMEQGLSSDMNHRYGDDSSFQSHCYGPMQYQRGQHTDQTSHQQNFQNQE
jgi:hypothetical protein